MGGGEGPVPGELEMELVEMHFVASLLELSSASVFTIVLPRFVTQYVTV